MTSTSFRARSLYRSVLRELPHRPLSNPSPLKSHIRSTFFSSPPLGGKAAQQQLEESQQLLQYCKSQRMYVTLLERYNPGMSLDEEERVKMTMRRVGMDAPEEYK